MHAGPGGTTNEPPFSGQKTEKQPFTEETTSQQVRPSEAARPSAPTTSEAVAKLVIIRPDGTEGATIPLKEGSVTIGRDSDHQTLANDPFLSPEHARVTVSGDTFTLEDLDSLNGIFYRIPGECELKSGDMIRLGQELLEFKHIEDVEALDAPETSGDDADTLRSGSPDVGYWGRLGLISGPGITTRSFIFAEDEINIGREIGDIVFRDDGFVSGRHARIAKIDGRVILKDLGSSNGTYVRIRGGRTLEDGDLVLMGQQLFRLVS